MLFPGESAFPIFNAKYKIVRIFPHISFGGVDEFDCCKRSLGGEVVVSK
jgi:hypothetical protein